MTPEQQARERIDKLLRAAGWKVHDPSDANIHAARGVAIREFPLKSGHGYADYLLYVDGAAAGVIEAKKEGVTLSGVETQSDKYTKGLPDGMPAWRNPLPFAFQSTGTETRFTNGLDPHPRARRNCQAMVDVTSLCPARPSPTRPVAPAASSARLDAVQPKSILYSRIANREYSVVLKPQDVLVLLKLLVIGEKPWSYGKLAVELGMSPAEVHAAAKRLQAAQLAVKKGARLVPNRRNLGEFLAHGLRYVFVPERGEMTRGMPTLHGAPPLRDVIVATDEPLPVWPDPQGEVRGAAFSPLYKSAPKAARADPALYELLVLVDAIRGGSAREREIAISTLNARLSDQGDDRMKQEIAGDYLQLGDQLTVSRAEVASLAKHFHIRKLALFGSAARGELRPDSDIDLLVEFEPGKAPSLGGMLDISDAFSALFGGRSVDLATASILENPYRRRAIERDMEMLYAA